MNITQKLAAVQAELKAPKGQYNSFGKYKYRSCEDILEAVKPLLQTHGLVLVLTDSVEMIGDRFYVVATATVSDAEGGRWNSRAYAREDLEKKGMDGAQITGTASSYARKYALNGLFCIDDAKDADTDEYTARTRPISKAQATALSNMLSEAERAYIIKQYGVSNIGALTGDQYAEVIRMIEKKRAGK